jgi:hypothetical protein
MRGEPLHIEPIIPAAELGTALRDLLSHYFARQVELAKVDRRVSQYCSSFMIEELDVVLEDGTRLELVLKDLSLAALMPGAGDKKPFFVYNPVREIETYRRILVRHDLGTPIYYGAVLNPDLKRYWLFLERVSPELLWQMGELNIWQEVASWLGGMHSFLVCETEMEETSHTAHLLNYDREFYWRWMRRAVAFVPQRDRNKGADTNAIKHIKSRYGRIVERLLSLKKTVIHGEFFASNVLIHKADGKMRVCPVDWEMAALGPGLVDLAGLTSGQWSPAEREAMALAYYDALPVKAKLARSWETFVIDLECCRLHQAIQWLGWSAEWTPPPEHAQNWLQEALRCCESASRAHA